MGNTGGIAMRTSKLHAVLAAVAVVGLGCPGPDDTTPPVTAWTAVLSAADVVPATASTNTGTGSFSVSGTTLTFTVTTTATSTRVDLRQAAAGTTNTSNTATIALCGSGSQPACGASPHTGTATVTEAQINTMRAFGFNVTVRSASFATDNGEIRGQLRNVAP